jgi:hypothetical protein
VLLGLALDTKAVETVAHAVKKSPLAWALAALVATAVLATATAVDVRQAFLGGYPDYRGLLSILAYTVVGAGSLVLWTTNGGARWLGRCAIAFAFWIGGLGVLHRLSWLPRALRQVLGDPGRVGSTLGNSSNLGVFLGLLAPLIVWVALRDEDVRWQLAAWVAVALMTLSLVLTLSRGAWVAAVIAGALGAILLYGRGRLPSLRVALVVGAVGVLIVAGVALTPAVSRRAAKLVDPNSSTAQWRISTWRSAAVMAQERPFLGYGPNTFRLAYPAFQAPRQVDGKRGYAVVEAAHNLEFDTVTSFGIPGLLLLIAVGALAAFAVVRGFGHDEQQGGLDLALGVALVAGVVSLQFHYVTMDTGPLIAVVLAGIVGADVRVREGAAVHAPVSAPWSRAARGAVAALGAAYAIAAIAALGVVAADLAVARANRMVAAGAPWTAVSAQLSRAEALAPWETQIVRARGTVATAAIVRHFERTAAFDGMQAFDRAAAMTPTDPVLAAERANLLLAAGLASNDRVLLQRSIDAFRVVQKMDPNTGIAFAGEGSGLLGLGQTQEGEAKLARAVLLSPHYDPAWRQLERLAANRRAQAK